MVIEVVREEVEEEIVEWSGVGGGRSNGGPWTAECQASLSFSISWSLLKFMSVELLMPSNYLIFCLSLFLPSVFPSSRVFSRVGSSH